MQLTEKELEAKKRVCFSLDTLTIDETLSLVSEVKDYVEFWKIGKILHTAAGNRGIPIMAEISHKEGCNKKFFLDLKFRDTPKIIYHASYRCAIPGVYMFDIYIDGGEAMCKKAIEGAHDGVEIYKIERPKVIGVTELTSLNDKDLRTNGLGIKYSDLVRKRTEQARKRGLDGVVCPASLAGNLEKEFGSDLLYVTPGIRWKGKKGEGQKQLYAPDLAVRDCKNSILVIKSAITKAENKQETAYEILQAMAKKL